MTTSPINVHLYPSPFRNESRMLKITGSLARTRRFDRIVIVGTHEEGLPEWERLDDVREVWRVPAPRHRGGLLGKIQRTRGWSARVESMLRPLPLACVNPHSLAVLPLAARLARRAGARLVYDTHELETETVESRGLRRRLARLVERAYVGRADAVSTVSQPIGDWYRRAYRLPAVDVVRNFPPREQRVPGRTGLLRAALGLPSDARVILYQGTLSRHRGIERLLRLAPRLSAGTHVVFMGYGPLEPMVRDAAARHAQVRFQPAVPPGEVHRYTADADIGTVLIDRACLSYYLCLPNKLFECLAAGVPVIANDFPGLREVVAPHECGWLVPDDDDDALQALIDRLSVADIATAAERARSVRDAFVWEREEPALFALYDRLGFPARGGG